MVVEHLAVEVAAVLLCQQAGEPVLVGMEEVGERAGVAEREAVGVVPDHETSEVQVKSTIHHHLPTRSSDQA